MLFFKTRIAVRSFAVKSGYKIVDNGVNSKPGRRWAVKVV